MLDSEAGFSWPDEVAWAILFEKPHTVPLSLHPGRPEQATRLEQVARIPDGTKHREQNRWKKLDVGKKREASEKMMWL